LDIDGAVDVDAVIEQLLDVEVTLGMAAAGCVGVGELVDQRYLRMASDHRVEVHLLEPLAPILEALARNDLEPVEQRLRLLASMRLSDADGDVIAVLLSGAGLLQHFVGFADTGRSAHENLEPAGLSFFPPRGLEQGLRRGSLVSVTARVRHQGANSLPCQASSCYRAAARSSAKLSANTFTRGSPRRPSVRLSICSSTSWRTRSSGMLRAFATRGTWKSAAAGEIWGSSPPP